MKNILFFIFLMFFSVTKAQNNEVAGQVFYDYQINPSEYSRNYNVTSILNFTKNKSLYEIDHIHSLSNTNKGGNEFEIKSKENEFIYKNFDTQNMYYMDYIELTSFNIKDSLNIMNWTLNENTKEILGYPCQEATTSYGGRFYIAYYTPEIPISNGPWRFNGLPGLILEVHSIDKIFNLKATSLKIKNKKIELKNPFENKKCMSWQGFLDLYKKKYDEVLRNNMTEFGPGQVMSKKGIVEYIKD